MQAGTRVAMIPLNDIDNGLVRLTMAAEGSMSFSIPNTG